MQWGNGRALDEGLVSDQLDAGLYPYSSVTLLHGPLDLVWNCNSLACRGTLQAPVNKQPPRHR